MNADMNRCDTSPLLAYQEALAQLTQSVEARGRVVDKPLLQALGAVLAESIEAQIDVPGEDSAILESLRVGPVEGLVPAHFRVQLDDIPQPPGQSQARREQQSVAAIRQRLAFLEDPVTFGSAGAAQGRVVGSAASAKRSASTPPKIAVAQATSSVARCPWARTVGESRKSAVVTAAARSPKSARVQR